MKKKEKTRENYLERIPCRKEALSWKSEENGLITLEIENRGVMNRIAQLCFRKPRISYVHLDEMGSFLWPLLDGKARIQELAGQVEERFGEKAHPLYERLARYIRILESYHFVTTKRED